MASVEEVHRATTLLHILICLLTAPCHLLLALRVSRARTDVNLFNYSLILCLVTSGLS